jgi:hypothetical protein
MHMLVAGGPPAQARCAAALFIQAEPLQSSLEVASTVARVREFFCRKNEIQRENKK